MPISINPFFLLTLLLLSILVRMEKLDEEEKPEEKESTSAEDEEFKQENGVYVLGDANFDAFLQKHPTAMVEFYAPWCGHCKELAPEYEAAAQELAGTIPLAKVDATVEKKLAERYKIMGFPSIFLWREGHSEPTNYDGDRDAQGIVKWLKEKTDPNYKPPQEEVVALTRETFDEFVSDKPIMLVEFYAPWCGHCKKLAPEYEMAAKKLKSHQIPLAKVDATEEKKLAEEYGVQGYPTLKILRNGRRFDYNGPREADGIVSYMLDQAQPAAKQLASAHDKFMAPADVAIVGFFERQAGPLYDAFVDAAERTRGDFSCHFVADSPALVKEFGAKPGQIILYYPTVFSSKYEPKTRTFPKSEATSEELLAFFRDNATPLVGQMTRMNAATRYAKRPLVVVYYNADFSIAYREGSQYWRNKVVEIANKYKSQGYLFAVADEEEFAQELNAVGLGDSGLEQNVVVFGVDGKKYPMDPDKYDDDELDQNLVAFLEDIGKGKVKPFLKSQPVPKEEEDPKSGPVRTVVGSNFDKIVKDESKDVLIEFYAPWCGHCKSFEPVYRQFAAKHAKDEPGLVVAKFDATANDVPDEKYSVQGFPTIYFAPAGKKDAPIKYAGNRDPEDLAKFMREHGVKSFQKGERKKKDEAKEEL